MSENSNAESPISDSQLTEQEALHLAEELGSLLSDGKIPNSDAESIQKMVDLAKMVRQVVSIGQKLQSRNIKKISMLLKTIDAML